MTRTVPDAFGILSADGPDAQVRFARVYPTSPGDLWSAVTAPERVARWLGRLSGDLLPGGTFVLDMADDQAEDPAGERATGEVLACEAPHRLVLSWRFPGEPPSEVEVEVGAHPGGALLVLEHRRLSRAAARGYGAGWHTFLDHLDSVLAGGPDGWTDRFLELLPAYRRRLPALGPERVEPTPALLVTEDAPATAEFLAQWLGWTVGDGGSVAAPVGGAGQSAPGPASVLRLVPRGPGPTRGADPAARAEQTDPGAAERDGTATDGAATHRAGAQVPVLVWADVDGLREALVSAQGSGADLAGVVADTVAATGTELVVPGGARLHVCAARGSAATAAAT